MRWKTTDPLSGMDDGTVYQEFTITLEYACYDTTVVLDNSADDDSDRTVIDGASAVTIDSAFDTSNDSNGNPVNNACDYDAIFQIWDDDIEEWTLDHHDRFLVDLTCADTDGAATDANGNGCSVYRTNKGESPTVCGANDVTSGSVFTAATMCCWCGGGDKTNGGANTIGQLTAEVDTLGGIYGTQSTFVEYTVRGRVVYTSSWSLNESYDEFDVTFKSGCYSNTLTSDADNGIFVNNIDAKTTIQQ